MRVNCTAIAFSLLALCAANVASADTKDMWTELAQSTGAFSPHLNNCDSTTEAYVPIGGSILGYCIEKSERTAAQWEDAKETCASVGKRLPENAEFKFACDQAGTLSLNNMTDDYEWTSNNSQIFLSGATTNHVSAIAGDGSCNRGSWGVITSDTHSPNSFVYRCVR